jgi:hypothetical protein
MGIRIDQNAVNALRNDEFMKRVDAAAIVVQDEIIRLLTLNDGAASGMVRSRTTGRRRKKLRYGARRSVRGQSPFKQTGQLSQSVAIERRPAELKCRIGDGVKYGSILELKMDRPHMRLALDNKTPDIKRILGG